MSPINLPDVGDVYEDSDPRVHNRRVRVIGDASPDSKGRPRVTVETIVNDSNPWAIGRKTKIAAHTLAGRFTKVSH